MIVFHEESKTFHLYNNEISYVFKILKNNQLGQLYYGKRIHDRKDFDHLLELFPRPMSPCSYKGDLSFSLEHIKQEYPVYGSGDLRHPAIDILQENGSHILNFEYVSHKIIQGKPKLKDLPATYVENENEAQTLIITLYDEVIETKLQLSYTIYQDFPVITRNAFIVNEGKQKLRLNQMMSMSLDLPDQDYEMIELTGSWARERSIKTRKLTEGIQSIYSLRGCSSHQFNPFIALKRENCKETSGEVLGFSLVYSGNFLTQVEVDNYHVSRVSMGIHPHCFEYLLDHLDSFQSPEVVMVYSDQGLNKMSQTYHQLYQKRLARGKYRDQVRPILVNNWEGTYFDFNEDKIISMANTAKELGIELFVLDDGWFGERNDDTTSLGDWWVNTKKIDLNKIIETCHRNNIKFGIWLEPEMISFNSKLYQEHPEYALGLPGINISLGRHQLVLDMTNKEAIENVYTQICDLLDNYKIDYVKIDFNRCLSEVYSATLNVKHQGEVYHRFMEGSYHLYEMLVNRYPNILFEHCASGGGRFDMGMLYYCPQIQASDSNDAVERVYINYASTYAYPLSCIGSHAFTGALLPYSAKCAIALFGTYGYEMNPLNLTKEDIKQINEAATIYKKYHLDCIQNGDLYRMESPYESNHMSMICVAKNKEKAIAIFFNKRRESNLSRFLKFDGLDDDSLYQNSWDKKIYSGKQIRLIGINLIKWLEEFETIIITFDKVND